MYNRYIPQSDGSHKRNPVLNAPPPKPAPPPPPPVPPEDHNECATPVIKPNPPQKPQKESAGSFLRNLLPRDLDTGDLLIIVLLLLLAGDNREDKNNALLTLALYLFM